ncbi:Trypsin [Thalassocella blandensis]|nr:Trypsin [Thalassocella blandensis]
MKMHSIFSSIAALCLLSNIAVAAEDQTESIITPKIVGGVSAEDGPYRWTISLQNNSGFAYCGGSLIAPQWILTAAHCVEGDSPSSMRVVVGRNNLNTSQGETRTVSQVIVHPNYSGESYDAALLKLSSAVSSNIEPVNLADTSIMNSAGNAGDMVRVLGWGATSEGGPSTNQLQRVDVPIVSQSTCNANYGGGIDNTMLCAGYTSGGKDSCQGDSGGPLVINYAGGYYQAGVVSWGEGCARAGKPGVYARVSYILNWIEGYIGDGGGNPDPDPEDELVNGTPVSGLSGSQGSDTHFTLNVPAGATNLNFNMSGGSGDADLYVRFGSAPTTSSYDCRPYKNGNTESCNFASASAGTYYVMVRAYSSYSGVTLVGSYDGGDNGGGDGGGDDGFTETNLSAGTNQWLDYEIDVTPGKSSLEVTMSGGSGDADLYVRYDSQPTSSSYNCRPYLSGNNEECNISNPTAGTWYIGLKGYSAFSGVTLDVKVK